MSLESADTQSSFAAARRCLRLYDLKYEQQLELTSDDEDREALEVGSCWHHAKDVRARGGDPYDAILRTAPSPLWVVKLARLFAGSEWYWRAQPLEITSSERVFLIELNGSMYAGQIDGGLQLGPRRGIVEYKTTAESIEASADYWKKLRLDVQVGLYGIAEERPDFILYDVTRKPTIHPKRLTEKERLRMRKELREKGVAVYYEEEFTAEQLEQPLLHERESYELYGARLTSDIMDRPDYYFARREVPRTIQDYEALERDLAAQGRLIQHARETNSWPRNPDACHAFGRACDFFSLCSINVHPSGGAVPPPGFQRREHRHRELVRDSAPVQKGTPS